MIAVPSLIILYFLKLRRRDVEVSTTLLWKKAIQDLQANAPFQRLRRNILLILQLLVLAGILAALGQPQIKGQTITGKRHVIMIDRSASMAALDSPDGRGGTVTRLEDAKKQAIALVESLREGGLMAQDQADEAMVIAFDTTSEVRQQFTTDKAMLRRAIESIAPTEGPTSIEEAMRLAKAHKRRRIVEKQTIENLYADEPLTIQLYTDGRIPDVTRAKPSPEDDVEFHRIGKEDAANMGIVGLRSERSYEDPNKLSVFVAVQNNEKDPRRVDIELLIDGVVAGIKGSTIPGVTGGPQLSGVAAARAEAQEAEASRKVVGVNPAEGGGAGQEARPGIGGVVFQLERGEGAAVQVRLREPGTGEALSSDVLALDDRAFLVVPPAKKMSVAIVSPARNLFISSVLSGLPLARLVELTPAQFEQKRLQGEVGEFDVVVLDGWLPTEGGKTSLPPGRFLVLGGVPANLGVTASGLTDAGKGGAAGIVDWKRDHPVMRNAKLDPLVIAEYRKVDVAQGSGAISLAQSDQGPAILELSTAEVRAVVVPWDVAASNWPFDVSFVVFVASSINYLGEDSSLTSAMRLVQPGSVLSDRIPAEAQDAKVKLPSGETQTLTPAADGRIVFGPIAQTGMYEVSWTGAAGSTDMTVDSRRVRGYAANLLDSAESNLAATDRVELANKVVGAANSGGMADKKLWPWLLLAALVIVMLEWFIYNRKVHV